CPTRAAEATAPATRSTGPSTTPSEASATPSTACSAAATSSRQTSPLARLRDQPRGGCFLGGLRLPPRHAEPAPAGADRPGRLADGRAGADRLADPRLRRGPGVSLEARPCVCGRRGEPGGPRRVLRGDGDGDRQRRRPDRGAWGGG